MRSYTFRFQRPERDGGITLIASFQASDHCEDAGEALAMLKIGITQWVQTTPAGRQAYEYSSEDFNIGDLASYWPGDKDLVKILAEHGIRELQLQTPVDDVTVVEYDTQLVLRSELTDD
jgi:hypothetical protein